MSAAAQPRPRTPIQIITDAVNAVDKIGVRLTTDRSPGVICTSTLDPTWERDPRARAVSPLGAVLLIEQPKEVELDPALAEALGVSVMWHLGFEFGCAGEELDPRLNKPPAARLAGEGFIAGVEMRGLLQRARDRRRAPLTSRCEKHGVWHPAKEPCPVCEEEQIQELEQSVDGE